MPRAHVNVVCQPSVDLVRRLADRTVDLALVTQGSGERGGTPVPRAAGLGRVGVAPGA